MLMFGTMPFVSYCHLGALFNWAGLSRNPRLSAWVCLCLYALPLACFFYTNRHKRVCKGTFGHFVCFISFWPLASEWYQTVRTSKYWRWSTAASFLPPMLSVVAVTIHLIWPIPLVPIPGDRVYRQIALNKGTR